VTAARQPHKKDDKHVSLPLSDDVFVPRWRALSYLRASKRTVYDYDDNWGSTVTGGGVQGLACECCIHQCSISEMTEYCNRSK